MVRLEFVDDAGMVCRLIAIPGDGWDYIQISIGKIPSRISTARALPT